MLLHTVYSFFCALVYFKDGAENAFLIGAFHGYYIID